VTNRTFRIALLLSVAAAVMGGCGGGGSDTGYTLSGTVVGLTGNGLVLTEVTQGTLTVFRSGDFSFPDQMASGVNYDVTVLSDPTTPTQGCTVTNGSGTIDNAGVTNITVTCNNTSEQLVVVGGNQLSTYLIDPSTGSLAPAAGSTMTLPASSGDMVPDPTGAFLYSTYTSGGTDVAAYAASSDTGYPAPISGSPFSVGAAQLGALLIDPSGKYLYAAATPGTFALARNGTSGALTPVAGSPFPAATNTQGNGACSVCTGSFLGASSSFLYYGQPGANSSAQIGGYAINSSTGALTSLGYLTGSGTGPAPLGAVNPAGTFLFVATSTPQTYTINTTTGALAPTAYPGAGRLSGIAVNAAGTFAYATNGAQVWGYSINATTGALTPIAGSPFAANGGTDSTPGPRMITFDPSGSYLYVGNGSAHEISGFTVDATTGALTPVPGSPVSVSIGGPAIIAASVIPQ
jgi:6-phosphogluconolactonase